MMRGDLEVGVHVVRAGVEEEGLPVVLRVDGLEQGEEAAVVEAKQRTSA